jgi:hypothetical protein
MGDRYTLMMLANELWSLTHSNWNVYPALPYQTRADGTVCHKCLSSDEFHQLPIDEFFEAPEKVLVGTPRGSFIRNPLDQGRLLQYFAWAGQAIETGVAFSVNDFRIEYWYSLILQQNPDDSDLSAYFHDLQICGLRDSRLFLLKSLIKSSQ